MLPRPLAAMLVVALPLSLGLSVAATSLTHAPRAEEPVRVRSGLLTGTSASRPKVRAYLGVPFAAPPVGDLRWRAPKPAAAWSGVRAAEHFSPACMQAPRKELGPWTNEFQLLGPRSEDCLYLNVWTSAARGDRRPVLVYVYGGAFTGGSGDVPVYDGAPLAERGLVVVNFNYRVGILGFFAHPELTKESGASGNYGLLDQVAALRWVRENIAAFGGDPNRVTLAGQSAGGMSVFLLTASLMAKGLFQRAVIESGPGGLAAMGVGSARFTRTRAQAESAGVAFAKSKNEASLAQLRAIPADSITMSPGSFRPDVDGAFLVEEPAETFAAGRQNDVPTLTGFNADEGSASPSYAKLSAEQIQKSRDAAFASLEMLLDQRAKTARTSAFSYYFDRVIPWPAHPEFGAFHSAEVPYVFGTLDVLDRPWTSVDRSLSKTMMSYWINFATSGDPNGAKLPRWPAFTPASPVFMELGDHVGPRAPLARETFEQFAK